MTTRAEEAGKKFEAVVEMEKNDNGLSLLSQAGWAELLPDPECWNFMHPDYMGVIVQWRFGDTSWDIRAYGTVDEDGNQEEWKGESHSYWPNHH